MLLFLGVQMFQSSSVGDFDTAQLTVLCLAEVLRTDPPNHHGWFHSDLCRDGLLCPIHRSDSKPQSTTASVKTKGQCDTKHSVLSNNGMKHVCTSAYVCRSCRRVACCQPPCLRFIPPYEAVFLCLVCSRGRVSSPS